MPKIKMTASNLEKLLLDFKEKLIGNRITNLTIVNSRDYVLSFSIYKNEKLLKLKRLLQKTDNCQIVLT